MSHSHWYGDLSNKVVLLEYNSKTIFLDGTYTCHHWPKDAYSLWAVIDGYQCHKHKDMDRFEHQEGFEGIDKMMAGIIIEALQKFHDEIDEVILDG